MNIRKSKRAATRKPSGAKEAILADRLPNESRNKQAARLSVNYMTLSEAERYDRWPVGAAGKLLRMALGLPAEVAK